MTAFFVILGGVRHETGQRSMIKVGLTSHPGIKRIKPGLYYTAAPTHFILQQQHSHTVQVFTLFITHTAPPTHCEHFKENTAPTVVYPHR